MVSVVVPASAVAAYAPAPSAPSSTTPISTPKPAKGSLKLHLAGALHLHGQPVSVPDRGVYVDGVVRPFVSGQRVTVTVYLGHRLIKSKRLPVKPSRRRSYGHFSMRVSSPHSGVLQVIVTHIGTPQQVRFQAAQRYSALDEHVGFGSTGRFVQLIQQRLATLHIFLRRTGVYDSSTGLALDAYHRLLGWGTSQALGPATITALLGGRGHFGIRFPRHGHHAEGNLSKQLLALADGSQVRYIFPISSGKPSTPTVLGDFRIYQRTPGYLPDGMYFSDFFIGGYAIHGYDPAPDYPASHGCMRLPIQDAIPAYHWLGYNDWVDVYY